MELEELIGDADIHCHPTMRAFHAQPHNGKRNLWSENYNEDTKTRLGNFVIKQSEGVAKVSQSNFYKCIDGGVRIVFDSLYPVERGFIRFKKFPKKVLSKTAQETLVTVSAGISSDIYKNYYSNDDYFQDLEAQYEFLTKNLGPSPCGNYRSDIPQNYDELVSLMKDPKAVAIILTIEGCHVLGDYIGFGQKKVQSDFLNQMLERVNKIKSWKYSPFFMTFAHHFWNGLCGHAGTLPPASRVTCTQDIGLDDGFTEDGWKVLEALLSKENGKRILIDTRHMSVKSRQQYAEWVDDWNTKNPDDIIPIITSHSAVNGFDTYKDSTLTKDNMSKKRNTKFCAWSLNVNAEEVKQIHKSKGLLGVILDKGRHTGINRLKAIENNNYAKKKLEYIRSIWDNIFWIVEAIKEKSVWDIIVLGSDFDGVITHFDFYEDMSKVPQLKRDMIQFLKNEKYNDQLWFDYTPEELVDKIFRLNTLHFLKRNFK
ncbi:MAG: dipeptidase [Flavobacteriales bacterium]|nr:dipeptidase [Flavobacteriales bacterium]